MSEPPVLVYEEETCEKLQVLYGLLIYAVKRSPIVMW